MIPMIANNVSGTTHFQQQGCCDGSLFWKKKKQICEQIVLNSILLGKENRKERFVFFVSRVEITHPANCVTQCVLVFMQILPTDARARRLFVTSGGLKKVQEIEAEPGTKLCEYITIINCCYPEELVRLLSFLFTHLMM